MSGPSKRITRSQTQDIVRQHPPSAETPSSLGAQDASLVTTDQPQGLHLQNEKTFNSPAATVAYIRSLPQQDQYPLLEELNSTLNRMQISVLNVQSDIIKYIQHEKLWRKYMDEREFLEAWDDTIEKTRKYRSQQDKIRTAITTIRQYWGDSVWERYLNDANMDGWNQEAGERI